MFVRPPEEAVRLDVRSRTSGRPTYGATMTRRFRFGYQLTSAGESTPIRQARRAEALGFDTFLVADHVGSGLAPLPVLAAAAAATETIRLGTFVLNADMRNPVQLAWDVSTLDAVSDGRVELGLGAGHTPQEYDATGIDLRSVAARKRAMRERFGIIRRLLDGETVDHDGEFHTLTGARIEPSRQRHLPMLVGGNGAALLEHAGAHADIVGLQGLTRVRADGHRHDVDWSLDRLDRQIEQIRSGGGERMPELNALVQIVDITDDPEPVLRDVAERIGGIELDVLAACPYVLIGSVEEIADKLLACRARWDITYFAVRALDEFQPVIDRIRQLDAAG